MRTKGNWVRRSHGLCQHTEHSLGGMHLLKTERERRVQNFFRTVQAPGCDPATIQRNS